MVTELTRTEYTTVIENTTVLTTLATDPVIRVTTLTAGGPQGAPGAPGPSGLEAEVPTDFVLIYRLSL